VDLDGFDAQVKLFGDVARGLSLAQQLEDFKFTVAQRFHRRIPAVAAPGKNFEDFRRHLFADINLAGEHLADGLHQLFSTFLFHDVTAAARAQNALGIKRFIMHRNDQHRQARADRLEILDQLQAVLARQRNIRQDQVRFQRINHLNRLLGVLRLAADGQIRLHIDELGQSLPHHRVIVHN